jgi:hypothetical protein
MSEDEAPEAEEPTLNRAQRRAAKKGGAAKGDQSSAKSRIQDLANARKASRPSPGQSIKSAVKSTGSQRGG